MFSVLIEIIEFRSRKFLDFTEKCLIKNYRERPNAEQMLTHSFSNSTIPDKIVKRRIHCPKGGYTRLRHNENRDTCATLVDEVCHDVEIEPKLQSLEGERFHNKTTTTEDDARLDIKEKGLWEGRFSRTFSDVKFSTLMLNPALKLYLTPTKIRRVSKQ